MPLSSRPGSNSPVFFFVGSWPANHTMISAHESLHSLTTGTSPSVPGAPLAHLFITKMFLPPPYLSRPSLDVAAVDPPGFQIIPTNRANPSINQVQVWVWLYGTSPPKVTGVSWGRGDDAATNNDMGIWSLCSHGLPVFTGPAQARFWMHHFHLY